MLDRSLQRFPTEVQTVKLRVTAFQLSQDTESLLVMAEAAERLHRFRKAVFARMAETCVAEVVRQRHAFCQVFIQT